MSTSLALRTTLLAAVLATLLIPALAPARSEHGQWDQLADVPGPRRLAHTAIYDAGR